MSQVVRPCARQGTGVGSRESGIGQRSEVGGRRSGFRVQGSVGAACRKIAAASSTPYSVLSTQCSTRCNPQSAIRNPRFLVLFALFIALAAPVLAQPPASTTVTDETEVQPLQPFTDLPELPETIVPGRLNAFPSEPLPADTVISPNRQPTPLDQTGSAVDVITSEYIDQISPRGGQTTVAEVLRGRLGLDVVRSGGPGGITSVFLRGANSGQTKVLLDGIPLNDPSNAGRSFDFSTLSVDNIERIEVLRGPQSMVYGSDAIGGVVNIITQRGQGPLSVRATGFGGTYNTGQTGLHASGGDEQKYYSVGGSFFSTGGISSASARNGNTEHDSFNLGTVSGRFGYNLGETWNVDYVFRYIDAAAEIDDAFSFAPPFLPIDNLNRKNLIKGFSNRVQLSNWLVDGLVQQRVGFQPGRLRPDRHRPRLPERQLPRPDPRGRLLRQRPDDGNQRAFRRRPLSRRRGRSDVRSARPAKRAGGVRRRMPFRSATSTARPAPAGTTPAVRGRPKPIASPACIASTRPAPPSTVRSAPASASRRWPSRIRASSATQTCCPKKAKAGTSGCGSRSGTASSPPTRPISATISRT